MDTNRWEFASPNRQAIEDEADGFTDVPVSVGQRERRMQVRAYNMWAGMLGPRRFPAVADLSRGAMSGFAPHSLLLDFTGSATSPTVAFLGDQLARECGVGWQGLERLGMAPAGSLLERLVRLYEQVLAVAAPTGFEAELINPHGSHMAYRGILLPFASEGSTADFVLAVVNWKELADEQTARQIIQEMGQTLPGKRPILAGWADGPCTAAREEPCPGEPRAEAQPGPANAQQHGRAAPFPVEPFPECVAPALAERLRMLPPQDFASAFRSGSEYSLIMVRHSRQEPPAILGEVPHDSSLLALAAERLLG